MKQFIEIEFTSPVDREVFRMKSGVSIGYNFSPFSPRDAIKNPDGLKEL